MKRLILALALALWGHAAFAQSGIGPSSSIVNEGATGTQLNKIAKYTTAAPTTAIIATTSDTTGLAGIVIGNAGTTGSPVIATSGLVSCVFDGATTAGHYVQASGTAGGDCHDTGAATEPTSGDTLGRVLSTNGGGGTYLIDMHMTPSPAAGSGTVTNSNTLTSTALILGAGTTVVQAAANALLNAGALTLGGSTTPGSVTMGNATSGTVKIEPTTGALGTTVFHIPGSNATVTAVTLEDAQAFTGAKSFAEAHGTSYAPSLTSNAFTPAITDCGKTLLMPAGTAGPSVHLPNVNPASGECSIKVVQTGANAYTIDAVSGGSVHSVNSYTKTAGQYAVMVATLLTPSASAAAWIISGEGAP